MRRNPLALLAAVAVLALGACRDTTPIEPQARSVSGSANALSCSADLPGVLAQAQVIFRGNGPNYNSVRGKLVNLVSFLGHRNPAQREKAKDRAHEIVAFTLKQYEAGRLSGTDEQVTAFVNSVYCLAGIDVVIEEPEDTWFILPTDQPQTLVGLDGTAAVSLAGFPVEEPSILRIERFEGQLNTKLDQYPGFVRITLLNEGGTGLTGRATISVCAEGIPTSVDFADLRLGHGIGETGFVITPLPEDGDPTPGTLSCDTEGVAAGLGQRLFRAVGKLVAPKLLHARQETVRRGGVTGTVTEFSPFAPVDTRLRSGGVTGTVTEFLRGPVPMSALMSESTNSVSSLVETCSLRTAGGLLPDECQPVVSITTRLGTRLEGVPVDWSIPKTSDGLIAPRAGDIGALSCGAFGRDASTFTSALGNAGVCWKLGNFGLHTVIATPSAGGDAPAGVTFDNNGEATVVFEVEVRPPGAPTQIEVVAGSGQTSPAGSATEVPPSVLVTDSYDTPVPGVTVHWQIIAGDGTTSTATAVTAADGLATTNWTLGAGYNQLKAFITDVVFAYVYLEATGTTP